MNELEMIFAIGAIDNVYQAIKEFSPATMLSILGCVVDQYGREHGMTQSETFDMLENLSEVQKEVHELLGA